MSDPATMSSFLDRALAWASTNGELVVAVIGLAGSAFVWVWANWIRPKRGNGASQKQTGGHGNSQFGSVTGPVTIIQGVSVDFTPIARLLAETAEAKARAEGRLAERDQQVRDLTAALTKAQSVASAPLLGAADSGPVTVANAQALALASEATLEVYFEAKRAEGASANREAAAVARHIGALAFLHDTRKALRFYGAATELDPDDPDAWNELGQLHHRVGDLANAETSFGRVLQLANTIADKGVLAAAYGNLGIVHLTRGDLAKAEGYYMKSLALNEALGRKAGMASAYGNLGLVHGTRGDLAKAEEYFKKSLAIEEALGRKEGMASNYGNLGNVYRTRGDLAKAEEYYRKSLAIEEALGRKEGMASDYGNLGIVHQTRGELAKAEENYERSLALNEALGRKEGMASAYGNLGVVHQTRGDLAKAEEHYKKSLALNEALGRKDGMASDYANLGNVHQTRGDLAKACEAWVTSRRLFTELGNPTLAEQVAGRMHDAGCPSRN